MLQKEYDCASYSIKLSGSDITIKAQIRDFVSEVPDYAVESESNC